MGIAASEAKAAQALSQYEAGEVARADALCDEILQSDPDHIQALHLSAAIAFASERAAEGARLLQRVFTLSPNNAQAFATLGNALAHRDDKKGAVAAFVRALTITPSDADLHVKLGGALRALKRFDEAEEAYRYALELNPSHTQAGFSLAVVLADQGRLEEAAMAYRDLLAQEPSFDALINLGNVLMDLCQHEQAVTVLRRAVGLRPLSEIARRNLELALDQLKRVDEAAYSRQAADVRDSVKSMSLILCTRNRAEQLRVTLTKINDAVAPDCPLEVVLIDMGSTDHTQDVFKEFAASCKWPVKFQYTDADSLGAGRNCGVKLSSGELLVFTDDDCYVEPNYFVNILAAVKPSSFQFGTGEILLYDQSDDPRVANLRVPQKVTIPQNSPFIPTGAIQGANMFFLRRVFEKAGMFDKAMGAGTKMGCEDIEMAARASKHGFTGALVPGFSVYHHHRRKKGSPEAERSVQLYDYGRGAYYGALLLMNRTNIWELWQRQTIGIEDHAAQAGRLRNIARELVGAARYFDHIASKYDGCARGAEGG
jgi:Flp pilus assembly protein TadD/GT2 family glycosyltransferase